VVTWQYDSGFLFNVYVGDSNFEVLEATDLEGN